MKKVYKATGFCLMEAGNTYIPILMAIQGRGYKISVEMGKQTRWTADKVVADDYQLHFCADSPTALLGLICLYEDNGVDCLKFTEEQSNKARAAVKEVKQ